MVGEVGTERAMEMAEIVTIDRAGVEKDSGGRGGKNGIEYAELFSDRSITYLS